MSAPDSDRSLAAIAWDLIKDPMFALLLAGGLLYLVLGAWYEAALLLLFVFVIFALTAGQSFRTAHVLDALGRLAAPKAMVLRRGERCWLPSSELVPGDIVFLAEGNRVPADGWLIDGKGLMVDESLLTGEFQPVFKPASSQASAPSYSTENADLSCGSLVLSGTGAMRVSAVGNNTRLGALGQSMRRLAPERAPLEMQTRRFIFRFMWMGFALSLATWALYVHMRGGWSEGMLAGIALAMSLLPQDFPVIVTVFSALEAQRIATQGVLARKLSVVETLGKTTVLCADKTGTMTTMTMAVRRLYLDSMRIDVPAPGHPYPGLASRGMRGLAETLVLASDPDSGDAMEDAFRRFASELLGSSEPEGPSEWTLMKTYPFSTELLVVIHVWRNTRDNRLKIACKGAPEAVFRLCGLPAPQVVLLESEVQLMAAEGLRVLAAAHASLPDGPLPDHPSGFSPMSFSGLVGLENPLKSGVADAVAACRAAGIRVLMLTGDHPATAKAIARQAGIPSDAVMLGDALAHESDDHLLNFVRQVSVYARVRPEQKLRLVQALKQSGAIVAMTGDGVNDAPALRAAHVGIAMGKRGTDVAREAAALVLTRDDFSDILGAIGQSRRLFDNLAKAVVYIVAAHIPIAGLVIIPLVLDWPEVLRPAHVAFLEIVIGPLCSLAFESLGAEPDLMSRPPLPAAKPLFSLKVFLIGATQGVTLLTCTVILYGWAQRNGLPGDSARALAFCTLVLGNLALMINNRATVRQRSKTGEKPAWLATTATLAMLLLALEWPLLRQLFDFGPLNAGEWAIALLGAIVVWLIVHGILHWSGPPWMSHQAQCRGAR